MTRAADANDDWAPLAQESVETPARKDAARENAKAIAMPKPTVPPTPAMHPGSRNQHSPPGPCAEAALQALRERLSKQATTRDPIAQAFRRASRKNPSLDVEPRTEPSVPQPAPDATVDCATELRFEQRDAREGLPWFRALPQHEQDRLRSEWRGKQDQFQCLFEQRRDSLRRVLGQGALVGCLSVLLTAFGLMFRGYQPLGAWPVWLVASGAAAAAIGLRLGGGRLVFTLLGMASYAIAMGTTIVICPNLLFALFVHGLLLGYIGLDLDAMRSGGFFGSRRVASVVFRRSRGAADAPNQAVGAGSSNAKAQHPCPR